MTAFLRRIARYSRSQRLPTEAILKGLAAPTTVIGACIEKPKTSVESTASAWASVGRDIRVAMGEFENKKA